MKYINDFLQEYAPSMIHSIAVMIISYVSIEAKKIYKKYINDKIKKEVVKMVCQGVEQLYPNKTGEEKLNIATINAKEILKEKNININELELRMYIEATVKDFNMQKENN